MESMGNLRQMVADLLRSEADPEMEQLLRDAAARKAKDAAGDAAFHNRTVPPTIAQIDADRAPVAVVEEPVAVVEGPVDDGTAMGDVKNALMDMEKAQAQNAYKMYVKEATAAGDPVMPFEQWAATMQGGM